MVRGINLLAATTAALGTILVVLGVVLLCADIASTAVAGRLSGVALFLGVTALFLAALVALTPRARHRP